LAGLAALGVAAYSVLVEPRWLEVKEVEVPLARLPRGLDGLRIAHLSDFHCSPMVSDEFLARCIRAATDADVDLALVTGDYVTDSDYWVPGLTPLLSGLRARHGVLAILGNHDHYVCPDRVAEAVTSAGVEMLRNESCRLEIHGETLWIMGIDSLRARQYRLTKAEQEAIDRKMHRYLCRALEGVDEEGCRILMAHSPDIFPDAQQAGIDLVLSGHTHGGQVRFPVIGATVVPSKFGARYAAGLFIENGTALYVNRGLGVVRLPIRFLCRPELSILTLRQA
jgi:predicted MPP superfamily phosphohydrolase